MNVGCDGMGGCIWGGVAIMDWAAVEPLSCGQGWDACKWV